MMTMQSVYNPPNSPRQPCIIGHRMIRRNLTHRRQFESPPAFYRNIQANRPTVKSAIHPSLPPNRPPGVPPHKNAAEMLVNTLNRQALHRNADVARVNIGCRKGV